MAKRIIPSANECDFKAKKCHIEESTSCAKIDVHTFEQKSNLYLGQNLHTVEDKSNLILGHNLLTVEDKSNLHLGQDLLTVEDKSNIHLGQDLHTVEDKSNLFLGQDLHTVEDKSNLFLEQDLHTVADKSNLHLGQDLHTVEDKSNLFLGQDLHTVEDKSNLFLEQDLHTVEDKSNLQLEEEKELNIYLKGNFSDVYQRLKKGDQIGCGGYGNVFKLIDDKTTEVKYVVKEMCLYARDKEKRKNMFLRESKILKSLPDHKRIVPFYGYSVTENICSLFLGYMTLGSISDALKYDPINEELCHLYTSQILEGLEFLHQQGVIHRDIKGGNILLEDTYNIRITDFGLAKFLDSSENTMELGTYRWMAPEVVNIQLSNGEYNFQADIWSLGCTVLEMITGDIPYHDISNNVAVIFQIASKQLPAIPPGISNTLRDFLGKTFVKNYKKRLTAQELRRQFFDTENQRPWRRGDTLYLDLQGVKSYIRETFGDTRPDEAQNFYPYDDYIQLYEMEDKGKIKGNKKGNMSPPPSPVKRRPSPPPRGNISIELPKGWRKGNAVGNNSYIVVDVGNNEDNKYVVTEIALPTDKKRRDLILDGLENELNSLRNLRHERIVNYCGFLIYTMYADRAFVFYGYISMISLEDLYTQNGPLREEECKWYEKQILEALNFLEVKNIAHMNIRGKNCIFESADRIRISGFQYSQEFKQNLFHAKYGSERWTAPEVINPKFGFSYCDHMCDIWSLGCTLVEMLTANVPYIEIETLPAVVIAIGNGESPAVPKHISVEMKDHLMKIFDPNPGTRPHAQMLLDMLLNSSLQPVPIMEGYILRKMQPTPDALYELHEGKQGAALDDEAVAGKATANEPTLQLQEALKGLSL